MPPILGVVGQRGVSLLIRNKVMTKPILLSLVLIALIYVASYFLAVRVSTDVAVGVGPWPASPRYVVATPVLATIFSPMHAIDRCLRYDTWRDFSDANDLRRRVFTE